MNPPSPSELTSIRTLILKHLAAPSLTAKQYLQDKRAELPGLVAGKMLIYLDTCHWINLRHVILKSPKAQPAYASILKLLEMLRNQDKIICPVSCASVEELMKQGDASTRSATAKVMDHLSCGLCMLNWIHLTGLEWEQHVAKTLLKLDGEINPFTKVGFWAGEHVVDYEGLPEPDRTIREKLYIDHRWAMSVNDYQAAPGFSKPPQAFFTTFVADAEKGRNRQTQDPWPFASLAGATREQLFISLKDDFLASLQWLAPVQSEDAAMANISACRHPLVESPTPWTVPSLQVLAGIEAAATFLKRKVVENDIYDFLHAAEAIPYCDAFFCDNPIARLLRDKPLEFHKAYSTVILSRPHEIALHLENLATHTTPANNNRP